MKNVPLYDGDENTGSAPLVTNLDTWDGIRWRFQHTGCHLCIGKLDDGRYYACYSSDWPEGIVRRKKDDGSYEILFRCSGDFGPTALAVVISEEEARELVREHKAEIYEEMFGEAPLRPPMASSRLLGRAVYSLSLPPVCSSSSTSSILSAFA